jgi:hypothetical protein
MSWRVLKFEAYFVILRNEGSSSPGKFVMLVAKDVSLSLNMTT